MASIGEAYIDVHANTLPFDKELDRDLNDAVKKSEISLEKTGTKFGETISKFTSKELKRRGREFGNAIEEGTKRVVIRVRSTVRFDRLRDSIRRFFRRDVGDGITEEIGQALDRAGRKGGPLSKFGETIADAVGAGFNVSGRSPLIAILLPALAALLGVILAALQAVNALVAVLFIIPGLLASIGVQVGVLVIAFQGIGTAIQGAFAAKNAKELRLALKDLTPSARSFVRSLLPLRQLFKDIQRTVQERFFNRLGGVITDIRKALGPSLAKGFGDVAAAFGGFFRSFGELLASPGFVKFFNTLIPATVRWVEKFGDSLFAKRGFVTALIDMATVLMPFMEKFGDIVLRNLDRLSGMIFQLGTNPGTQQWLDNMASTLQLVFDLLFKVGEFLFVFLAQLDKAGGQEIFKVLMEALNQLIFVLASPVGQKAMEGLVNFGIIGIKVFTGLVVAVLGVFAAFEVLFEWLRVTGGPFILDILRAIGQAAVDMATFLGVWIERIIRAIGGFFVWLWGVILTTRDRFNSLTKGAGDVVGKVLAIIKALPGQIISALGNLATLLLNSGRAIIQGLIDGVRQKIGELRSMLGGIAGLIAGFFGSSPAIYGPLKGKGWMTYRGRNIMRSLVEGARQELPLIKETSHMLASQIVFGPQSVQVNFQGALPTKAQAQTTGTVVGRSAANLLAARNTRLAIRTL